MKTKTTFLAAVSFVAALSFATAQTAAAQCRDSWINNAYKDVAGRSPVGEHEGGECNIKLYNNGSWGNYDELKGYVRQLKDSGTKIGYAALSNGTTVMAVQGNGVTAIAMLDRAGNIISGGAGNFSGSINRNTPGFSFASGYSLQSGRSIKTSGKGGLKIQ